MIGAEVAMHDRRQGREQGFGHTRDQVVERRHQPPAASDRDLADRMGGAVQDDVGDDMGGIDRPGVLHGPARQVQGVVLVGGVDRGRLDQGEQDRRLLADQLHPKCIGEAAHGVLGGRIDALDRQGRVAQHRADGDDGAPAVAVAQPLGRQQRAVHHAPVVGLEQAAMVLGLGLADRAVDRDPRVVHPGVETAEQALALVRGRGQGLRVGHVGDRPGAARAARLELLAQLAQVLLAPRDQEHAGSALGGAARRRQADAGGGAGDDEGLTVERLEARSAHDVSGKVSETVRADAGFL